jgi:cobalamin biosynthesis protein CbiG
MLPPPWSTANLSAYTRTRGRRLDARRTTLPENLHVYSTLKALKSSGSNAAIIITDRMLSGNEKFPSGRTVIYRPRSLVLGIGCNRGTSASLIEEAVNSLFAQYALYPGCIRNIATINIKRDEQGINEFARQYHLPVEYFDMESLGSATLTSAPSPAALRYTGAPGICEAAAVLSSGNESLLCTQI